jgi:hypothetical protein
MTTDILNNKTLLEYFDITFDGEVFLLSNHFSKWSVIPLESKGYDLPFKDGKSILNVKDVHELEQLFIQRITKEIESKKEYVIPYLRNTLSAKSTHFSYNKKDGFSFEFSLPSKNSFFGFGKHKKLLVYTKRFDCYDIFIDDRFVGRSVSHENLIVVIVTSLRLNNFEPKLDFHALYL